MPLYVYTREPFLKRSTVLASDGKYYINDNRTSRSTEIRRHQTPIVECIERRFAQFQGDIDVEHMEPLQVVEYTSGKQVKPHYDWFSQPEILKNGGQRVTSFFTYLEDNCSMGETEFLDIPFNKSSHERFCDILICDENSTEFGIRFRPLAGNSVFWYNTDEYGEVDYLTYHAGRPPGEHGRKIGLNTWTHTQTKNNMHTPLRHLSFKQIKKFALNIFMDKSNDPINSKSNAQSYLSVSTQSNIKYKPMPDPLSVYVPLNSLTEETIDSIVSTVQQRDKRNWNQSKRTLLAFLLAINNKVNEIEQNNHSNNKFDEQTVQHAAKVREWLIEKVQFGDNKELQWDELRQNYEKMVHQNDDNEMAKQLNITTIEPYYELAIEGVHRDVNRSREYMARFRSCGWKPNELKLYWNATQLENLCPKYVTNDKQVKEKDKNLPSHDPSDADAVLALRQYPVSKRIHAGTITYVNKGIQDAVFDAPKDAQLIVLNFANERTPGGGYLRHSLAQEEIILYNSDGYRSLLDLKYGRMGGGYAIPEFGLAYYGRMGGGYAIPEFGLAYVRDIRFFDARTDKNRRTDMLVSACYCLSGSPQLYKNPPSTEECILNHIAKFRAFIAAAVANTIGDGSNTYLLLGPIGTGAFGNDVNDIGYAFREVLSSKMMGSNGPIRQAFGNIWFVSTDKWKNNRLEKILSEDGISNVE
ncbi:unnamed protein product [Adineta steineri]|uniref:Prolyl 4-hydroxylase alpha subunit domain-containing protein n=2 Tax=Adineta steineri TaxID=433720 RepID=A0A814JFH0_9BILA|nr:unnamed protein product [Adineta steineri]